MVVKQEVAYGIVRGLTEFWKCEELRDFTVTLGEVHFECHRLLLAACSDFFRALFRSQMQETEQKRVTINDISSETFELILETIYTGHGVLTNDNVIDIWRAAHQLQIHFLVSECENFVINTLSMENYAEYFYVSNTLNSAVVLETLWPFVIKNCNSFFQTNYFLQLPMADVLSLIKCQDLEIDSEDEVLHAIFNWVEFQGNQSNLSKITADGLASSNEIDKNEKNESCSGDEPAKKKCKINKDILTVSSSLGNDVEMESFDERNNQGYITDRASRCSNLTILLSHARTCLASQGCLKALVIHPLVRDIKEAKDVFSDALLYHRHVGKRNGQWPSRAIHRNNSDFIHCLVNAWKKEQDVVVSVYSLSRKEWLKLRGLTRVETIKLTAIDKELYTLCTGHVKNPDQSKKLFLFQLQKGRWLDVKISLTLRSDDFSVTAVDSFMYIFSAQEQMMWKFDPATQKVTQIPILADHEGILVVVPYDQSILVFYADDLEETVVYCFHTLLNTWTQLNNLKGPATGMTSFKDDHFTFLLQSNGALWKVVKPQTNAIDFEFVVKLWNLERPLQGAVTFLGELYIHVAKSDNPRDDIHLRRCLPGVFSKINFIERDFTKSSLSIPITLERKYVV